MAKEGQIKKEDIISNEALEWGKEYSKTIKKAIKQNEKFIKSAKKVQKNQLKIEKKLKRAKLLYRLYV